MNEIEQTFVKHFIVRHLRERWLTRLASKKTRPKVLNRLAHTFATDLDPRYRYDKEHLPPEIAAHTQQVLRTWKQSTSLHLCSIIALDATRDGQMMPLAEAEADYGVTTGAIIIIPDRLAYYHPERSNLSQQPFYVLFRPS